MAHVNYTNPIADMHGKLAEGDKVVFRTRNGMRHAYAIKHPYKGKPSVKQSAARASFREITQQIKAVYANPEQLADWQARFMQFISTPSYKRQLARYMEQQRAPQPVPYIPQPKLPKPPTTLYGFIFSTLSSSSE